MERSTVQVLVKRGKSQRQIAKELGHSRTTIARALQEPVDRQPAQRHRPSQVDPYRPQIEQWVRDDLSIVRMLELVRADPERPYTGGRSTFNDMVRRIRLEIERVDTDVPVRFEGLPAEYLQVDWGEIRRFPFTQQPPATPISWPAASSTAGGAGCAGPRICGRRRCCGDWSIASSRWVGCPGCWSSTI